MMDQIPTKADQAFKIIEEMIVTIELKPLQVISENELSAKLGIGRMPIREALKRLEAADLVTSIPRKGVLVKAISIEGSLQQLEVRMTLETFIMKKALNFISETEKSRLIEIANAYEEATTNSDDRKAVRLDNEFNDLIGRASRNPYAVKALQPLLVQSRRIYYLNYKLDEELTKEINFSHIRLMRKIVNCNEREVLMELENLFELTKELVSLNIRSML